MKYIFIDSILTHTKNIPRAYIVTSHILNFFETLYPYLWFDLKRADAVSGHDSRLSFKVNTSYKPDKAWAQEVSNYFLKCITGLTVGRGTQLSRWQDAVRVAWSEARKLEMFFSIAGVQIPDDYL